MNLAPIVLFVYNRPEHTLRTLEALKENHLADQSFLFVYSDGPKNDASIADQEKISEVRRILKIKNWCKEVNIIEDGTNKGLAKSIEKGVTEVVNKYGKVIVLEDDLITSKGFLEYMNKALDVFERHFNVYAVTGHMFQLNYSSAHTILLPYISTWGWGTWKDKWKIFHNEMSEKDIIISSSELQKRFNLSDYNYISMLQNLKNSWGIKWYYNVFIRNGLSVFPSKTLVENIGLDGSGTNCKVEFNETPRLESSVSVDFVDTIDLKFWKLYLDHFTNRKRTIFQKIRGLYVSKNNE